MVIMVMNKQPLLFSHSSSSFGALWVLYLSTYNVRNKHPGPPARSSRASTPFVAFCRSACCRRDSGTVPPHRPGQGRPHFAPDLPAADRRISPGRQWSCSQTMLFSVRGFIPVWPEAPFTVCALKWSRRSSSCTNLALRYVARLQVRF